MSKKAEKETIYEEVCNDIDFTRFGRMLERLWIQYTKDKKEAQRTDLRFGEPVFNADRFILFIIRKYGFKK